MKDQYISKKENGQDYSIARTSTTKFNKNGIASGSLLGIAESKLGARYYWAKQGPDEFDCSGFVYWCYKQVRQAGIKILLLLSLNLLVQNMKFKIKMLYSLVILFYVITEIMSSFIMEMDK